MTRSVRTASILVAVLLGLGLVLYLVRQHAPVPNVRPGARNGGAGGPVAVSVATATQGDIAQRIPALGTIVPLATVTIKTQISGQLQKIAFTEGQQVHAGEFLAQIDPRPFEAALAQVESSLHRDEALLGNAQVDVQRYQDLIAQGSIAEQQLATQKATVAQLQGTVEGDRAQINTAKLNLRYTHIVSPIDGRVGLRQVDEGNYVTPGDANGIVVITRLQPITALFSVPEDNITAVMKQAHAGAPLQVSAWDRGNDTRLADGKLLAVDNQIDSATGTFKLRAQFDNTDGLLFPNQFVNIQLLVDVLHDQVIVPNAAVNRGAPNGVTSTFVYLVDADRTVAVRPVTLGTVDGDNVAVSHGLAAGDVVVTAGGDRLREGAAVMLPDDLAARPTGTGKRPPQGATGDKPRKRKRDAQ